MSDQTRAQEKQEHDWLLVGVEIERLHRLMESYGTPLGNLRVHLDPHVLVRLFNDRLTAPVSGAPTPEPETNILGDHGCANCGEACDCCQPGECIGCSRCYLRPAPAAPVESCQWRDIASAPKDDTVILRPHRIWGAMDVRRMTEAERAMPIGALSRDVPWAWLNGDTTTAWTEDAFLPFWMPRPVPPVILPTEPHA